MILQDILVLDSVNPTPTSNRGLAATAQTER